MSSVKIESIRLERAEGPIAECGPWPVPITTWSNANAILRGWALTAPKTGGYDKCDVVVRWENGVEYALRFDLTFEHSRTVNLAQEIARDCAFWAGLYCPPHLTVERYQTVRREFGARLGPERQAQRLAILGLCDLDGEARRYV